MDPADIRRGFSADSTVGSAETINAKGHATREMENQTRGFASPIYSCNVLPDVTCRSGLARIVVQTPFTDRETEHAEGEARV